MQVGSSRCQPVWPSKHWGICATGESLRCLPAQRQPLQQPPHQPHAASPVGQELISVSRRCTNTSDVTLGLEAGHQENLLASTELLLSATGGRGAGFKKARYKSTAKTCALQVRWEYHHIT